MNEKNKTKKEERKLSIARPDLMREWHPTKNETLNPMKLTIGSGKKAWWQCEKGHEWEATIKNRTKGSQCPACQREYRKQHPYKSRYRPENLLINNYPQLLKQWHPVKNADFDKNKITIHSNFKIWWQCQHGHEWERRIPEQIVSDRCPYCTGKFPIKGKTDFQTTHPEIAKEWHPTKNRGIEPSDFTFGSARLVWWQCEKGHEWEAKIFSRTSGANCSECQKERSLASAGLSLKNPELLNEWHPTLNEGLNPEDFTFGSSRKVWWRCKEGHEWQSKINSRAINKTNCPYCRGNKLNPNNTLGIVHPNLAEEWHPTKNGTLTPFNITKGSSRKVWWQCKQGHEWQAVIANRSLGNRCPYCVKQEKKQKKSLIR